MGVHPGDSPVLTYQGQPLAVLDLEEVYSYDKEFIARQVYGTTDTAHPGVLRTYTYKDRFLAGPITLLTPPTINPPFDRFWRTPHQLRQDFAQRGWSRIAAFQTRNVPHSGHEWMMKGGWLAASADAVLVSAVIGEKKSGDYIDEAIVLAHERLREAGFFRQEVHMTSILLWDMRYAGPKEAVFHALVRKNLGCTHHMFGRDHAGVRRGCLRGVVRPPRPEARPIWHTHPQHHSGWGRTGTSDPASRGAQGGAGLRRAVRFRVPLRH